MLCKWGLNHRTICIKWHSPGLYTWTTIVHNFLQTIFPKCLRHTTPGMFADDTHITTVHEDISTIENSLNSDLTAVHNWLKTNKLSCSTSKTSYMTIGSRQNLGNANNSYKTAAGFNEQNK